MSRIEVIVVARGYLYYPRRAKTSCWRWLWTKGELATQHDRGLEVLQGVSHNIPVVFDDIRRITHDKLLDPDWYESLPSDQQELVAECWGNKSENV